MKIYNTDIAQLKRHIKGLSIEVKKLDTLLERKSALLSNAGVTKKAFLKNERYDMAKIMDKETKQHMRENDALLAYKAHLLLEIGEYGSEIIAIRRALNESCPITNKSGELIQVKQTYGWCSKLFKLLNEQRQLKTAIKIFARMINDIKSNKPLITYRGTKYFLETPPFSLEKMEERLGLYLTTQRENGIAIQRMRQDILYSADRQAAYQAILKNMRAKRSGLV